MSNSRGTRWGILAWMVCLMGPLSVGVVLAEPPDGFTKTWREIETLFRQRLQERHVTGGSLMFVQDGQVIGSTIYGMADSDAQRKINAKTIYHWGSITKTLTGIAIMQLRDRFTGTEPCS